MTAVVWLAIGTAVIGLAAAVWLALRRLAPARFFSAAIEPEPLAAEIARQLDADIWKLERDRDGVRVYSSSELGCPFVGFRTVTEHRADLDEMANFLGDNLLEVFAELNDRYAEGAVLKELSEPVGRVVRTSFTMPPPLADREFVHLLYTLKPGPDERIIAYHSVDDPDLPPPQPGFVRCPIYPSGQRLRRLEDGRVRVEHLMVYDLAGRVSPWVQNHLFRSGHVGAYVGEWRNLVRRFQGRGRR